MVIKLAIVAASKNHNYPGKEYITTMSSPIRYLTCRQFNAFELYNLQFLTHLYFAYFNKDALRIFGLLTKMDSQQS